MRPMTTTATRRRAVTLTEVLISIFLMGIGLMAILSLFPLGAAQMAQALKDQRSAEAATNAAAMARVIWKTGCDDDPNTGANKFYTQGYAPPYPRTGLYPFSNQPFVTALDDPSYASLGGPVADYNANAGGLQKDPYLPTGSTDFLTAMPTVPRTGYIGPSYPVFVDPVGWQANAVNVAANQPTRQHQSWLPTAPVTTNGGARVWRIPRRPLYVPVQTMTATTITNSWAPLTGAQRIFKQ